ncbi:MAG: hypothetical protein ACK6CU_28170 [Deltaproteobacteria bacterium]
MRRAASLAAPELAFALLASFSVGSCQCEPTAPRPDSGSLDGGFSGDVPPDVVIGVSIYGLCGENTDTPWNPPSRCRDGVACIPTANAPRRMCTVPCADASDCPAVEGVTTACIPIGEGGQRLCVVRCVLTEPWPCLVGQTCDGFDGQTYCL